MEILLGDIAMIQPGVYMKTSPVQRNEKAYLVGIKDFDDDFQFLESSSIIDVNAVKSKYILTNHDLLFSVRVKFNAFIMPHFDGEKYVASNSFVILRPDINKVMRRYLYWYLNHPKIQKLLLKMGNKGGRLPFMSTKQLRELPIELPEKREQEKIINIHKLRERERVLTERLQQKKQIYIQQLLLETAKK